MAAPKLITLEQIPDWAQLISLSLLEGLRLRDPYTYGHCRRVARNARLLAKSAGLGEWEQKKIEQAALFHDLGKVGDARRQFLHQLAARGHLDALGAGLAAQVCLPVPALVRPFV